MHLGFVLGNPPFTSQPHFTKKNVVIPQFLAIQTHWQRGFMLKNVKHIDFQWVNSHIFFSSKLCAILFKYPCILWPKMFVMFWSWWWVWMVGLFCLCCVVVAASRAILLLLKWLGVAQMKGLVRLGSGWIVGTSVWRASNTHMISKRLGGTRPRKPGDSGLVI